MCVCVCIYIYIYSHQYAQSILKKMLILFQTKDTKILFLVEYYTVKTDIIGLYSLLNSLALKFNNKNANMSALKYNFIFNYRIIVILFLFTQNIFFVGVSLFCRGIQSANSKICRQGA